MSSSHQIFPLLIVLITGSFAAANNYDAYMADLAAQSQLAREEFLRNNPRGQMVLDRLNSPDYRKRHPVLGQSSSDQFVDDERWMNFLDELNAARQEAALGLDASDKREPEWYDKETPAYVLTDYNYSDPQEVNPRRLEVPYQNPLWGVHKVTGGSSEVGKWLDYALLGAGAQDEEDTDLSGLNLADVEQESMTKNDSLPAYCDPPNPCPIGYDPDIMPTPCDPNTEYTMELNRLWILSKVARGECACDSEHMNTCQLDDVGDLDDTGSLERFKKLSREFSRPNPYLVGQKRKRLVAKKASSYSHPKRDYYMRGKVLKNVVKKNGPYAAALKE